MLLPSLVAALCLATLINGKPMDDLITDMPGLNLNLTFDMFSGYLNGGTANNTKNHIFYYLTEYQMEDTDDIPIILWLNGGPGCSSLGGLMTELGPLRPNSDGATLHENVYAWNKVGHVVHFESPPGVGFSYADNDNVVWSDDEVSELNVNALNDFFLKYPEFSKRKFYITGESYSGVYLPTLAKRIVEWTVNGKFNNTNFMGMAIGNGAMDERNLFNGLMNYFYGHGTFGDAEWNHAKESCCGSASADGEQCDFYTILLNATTYSECVNATIGMQSHDYAFPDAYNIYQSCYQYRHMNALANHLYPQLTSALMSNIVEPEVAEDLMAMVSQRTRPNFDSTDQLNGFPCYEGNMNEKYLNRPAVLQALHVADSWIANKANHWTDCSDPVFNNYKRQYPTVRPVFDYLLQPFTPLGGTSRNLRLMIYNGDVDSVCNFLGDQWFGHEVVEGNALNTLQNHSIWWYETQIAGFVERYDHFDIMTVNGAGHFVPMDRAGPALQMLSNFIHATGNYSLPNSIAVTPLQPVIPTHADKITSLPGMPYDASFEQFSGYLNGGTTEDGATNHMFYWLAKYQQQDNINVPVILWLNGGPGCSSLGGFFTENGPFFANNDAKTVFENVFSWNKVGHVLYLESPPGVGFSYNDNWNTKWNDDEVAMLNALSLEDFFKNKFPEFKNRPFYITGESYGGTYIPTLSQQVVEMITKGTFTNTNFMGFAIGNGCLDSDDNFNGAVNMAYYHGFMGQTEWRTAKKLCCPSVANNAAKECNFAFANTTKSCDDVLTKTANTIYGMQDPYNMYQSCYAKKSIHLMSDQMRSLRANAASTSTNHLDGFACFGDTSNRDFLRRSDVQKAIHINEKWITKMDGNWSDCTDLDYTSLYPTKHEQFNFLLKPFTPKGSKVSQTLRLMIYNGDVDYVCNFLGDEWFGHDVAKENKLTEVMKRQDWRYSFNLAGSQQIFDRFDILTVNGAGHFVPMDRGGPALQMLYNFIHHTGNYSMATPIDVRPVLYDAKVMMTMDSKTTTPKTLTTTPKTLTTTPKTLTTTPKTLTTTPKTLATTAGSTRVVGGSWLALLLAVVCALFVSQRRES